MIAEREHGWTRADQPGSLGVVVIGRNEGRRLRRCFESIVPDAVRIVYVDSGSTDGSAEVARCYGAEVVELDASFPFCAARARNAGYRRLLESDAQPRFVQFIDGDCEIANNWLPFAVESLARQPDLAAVAGWLRERSPQSSIYNRLGDLEWNSAGAGEVAAVGGIFMIRSEAFDGVGGFDPTIAAGEEPELCQRLIRQGWRLTRLDKNMATHDLAMTRFTQWWRRMVRGGYGSMDVGWRFGVANFSKNNRRVLAWTCWFATVSSAAMFAAATGSTQVTVMTALLLCLWPAQLIRITLRMLKKGHSLKISGAYAFFMAISFLPQAIGQARYLGDRLRNRRARLIEYKGHVASRN